MSYRHTQRGTTILVTCLLVGVLSVGILWGAGQWPQAIVLAVLLGALAVLFSSLTVEVSDQELRWYFGPGLWTYRVPLDAIKQVTVVRNHWWNGWGIRIGPGLRLYNVSGLDAVELSIGAEDVRRRIGTDDPEGLAAALKARRGA